MVSRSSGLRSGIYSNLVFCRQKTLQHEGFFRYLGIFNSERLVFTSVEAVIEVLQRTQDFIQPELLGLFASPITGYGLVLVNGSEHKRQRKLLQPSMSTKQIRGLHPIFWNKASEVTLKLEEIVKNSAAASGFSEPIDIEYHAGLVGLDIISTAALGVDFQSVKDPNSDLVRNYRGTFEPTVIFQAMAFARLLLPKSLVEGFPLRRIKDGMTAIKLLRAACLASVREKTALAAKGQLETDDIVSTLIRDRGLHEEDELLTHMMTMLGAGHETVAVGLTWAVYELCRQPQWQTILRSEIRANIPSLLSNAMPPAQCTDTDKMPYLNAFISEVLRYWPPAPQVVRTCVTDTTVAGVAVPATTKIQLSVVAFNRDPQNWGPKASSFEPDRWLQRTDDRVTYNPNGAACHKYAFMTFIHGPRNCIGQTFARNEMLAILACWIGTFDFVLTDRSLLDENKIAISGGGLTSKPLHGIHVHARRVPGW